MRGKNKNIKKILLIEKNEDEMPPQKIYKDNEFLL